MSQGPWTSFFLETNQYTGPVLSHEDWTKVRGMHSLLEGDVSVLTRAKHMPDEDDIYGMPKFDFKPYMSEPEIEAARTQLYDWASSQGMDLAA